MHQPFTSFVCGWAVSTHYLLLANTIYAQQIYSATAIKREVGKTRNTEYRNNGITFN